MIDLSGCVEAMPTDNYGTFHAFAYQLNLVYGVSWSALGLRHIFHDYLVREWSQWSHWFNGLKREQLTSLSTMNDSLASLDYKLHPHVADGIIHILASIFHVHLVVYRDGIMHVHYYGDKDVVPAAYLSLNTTTLHYDPLLASASKCMIRISFFSTVC